MALLNFANTYDEISSYLNKASDSADYVKLLFSKDGHIITHGTDYTPDFGVGVRGLVKGSTGNVKDFLRGNNTWSAITTSDLPIASSISDAINNNTTESTILTALQIINYIGGQILAADAMRFKGTISWDDSTSKWKVVSVSGTTTDVFPTDAEIGDTYRIGTAYTYAGEKGSAGDIMICIKDYSGLTSNQGNSSEYWTVIEANINGVVKNSVNGTPIYTYSSDLQAFNIYAPTDWGNENQVLISQALNKAPVWVDQSTITAGQAGSVKAALSTGTGLTMGNSVTYNGSTARTIQLVAATNNTLGGVIIGDNISVDAGTISITKDNIIAALGYTPGNASALLVPATNTAIGGIKVGSVGTSASNAITTVTTKNYAVHIDSNNLGYVSLPNFVTSSGVISVTIKLGEGITVSDSGTAITSTGTRTISLNQATDSTLGGIKIGYKTSGKNYAVLLSDGKAYVSVPWSNTTYNVVSDSADGLAPKVINTQTATIAQAFYILASSDGSAAPSWYKLPANAFANTNTWRAIKVGGTLLKGTATTTGAINFVGSGKTTVTGSGDNITINSTWRDITIGGTSIGDDTLNFVPSEDIYLKADSTADGIADISFGISWYNISTKKYETT